MRSSHPTRPKLRPPAAIGIAILVILLAAGMAVRSWAGGTVVTLPAGTGAAGTSEAGTSEAGTGEAGTGAAGAGHGGVVDGGAGAAGAGAAGAGLGGVVDEGAGGQPGAGVVVVHVTGAVNRPGVFVMPAGSRIDDAIKLAGGFAPDANEAGINRALPVQDGQQVKVPMIGESPSPGGAPPGGSGTGTGGAGGGDDSAQAGRVNLNTASATELQSLPGIGPVLAAAIIEWRERHGGFTAVADLDDVPGIGPVLMERLAPLVTV